MNALTLIERLEVMSASAPDSGLSLSEIRAVLGEGTFGAMMVILALPVSIPFLYGVPQIVSVPMLALAAQMMIGRGEPWLPRRLALRRFSKPGLVRTAQIARKWFGWIEVLARPRLMFLTWRFSQQVIGACLCMFCACILIPLPLTNTVPGIAVAVIGFGLVARDGLLIIPGLILGLAWVAGLIFLGEALVDFIASLLNAVF